MTTDYKALLSQAYQAVRKLRQQVDALEDKRVREPLAVVGLGCRFPGGATPEAFWAMLRDGGHPVREIPAERWRNERYYREVSEEEQDERTSGTIRTRWACLIDEVDRFDAAFFGISPREARRMDPQQRLLLEVAWEALENAAILPETLSGTRAGVFVGVGNSDYNVMQVHPHEGIDAYVGTGSSRSLAANRLSYVFNLHGPSVAVDTACSSSLVALDMAAKALHAGESDLALVGGVNLILSPELSITFSQAQMLAPDGRCKTFDASADGYVRGEGAGMLVVKRLSDAQRDGDRVLALIRGTATNQDGRSNGLTAPNGTAQQRVIRQALERAQLQPTDVHYVEAHGTGTSLGDPIEMLALGQVYGEGRDPSQPLLVGSVKTNVGHLEAAAGMIGLTKVILSLQHRAIPPHLHFETPNPYIPWDDLPVKVPRELTPLPEGVLRAGVSSFGFGGSNAHVIVEGYEPAGQTRRSASLQVETGPHPPAPAGPCVLKLSAKQDAALRTMAQRAADALSDERLNLADALHTANLHRADFERRAVVLGASRDELREGLRALAEGDAGKGVIHAGEMPDNPDVVLMFTGQGAQRPGMSRQLYEADAAYREALDEAAEGLLPHLGEDLRALIFNDEQGRVHQTAITQPALFALEYALAQAWRQRGVTPVAAMGHSVGELVAACLAGVFSLEDGLKLIAARGRLMQALPSQGGMAAIFADVAQVEPLLRPYRDRLALAAANSPQETVISGAEDALQAVLRQLGAMGVNYQPLKVSHAFHSPLMEPMLDDFAKIASEVRYYPPNLPLVSNVSGTWAEADAITRPDYWVDHVRQAVRFADGLRTAYDSGYRVFLEVGPRPTLSGMGARTLSAGEARFIASLHPRKDDVRAMAEAFGALYVAGVEVDWHALTPGERVPWPTYAFQRKRYWWLDGLAAPAASSQAWASVPAEAAQAPPETGAPERDASGDNAFVADLAALSADERRQRMVDRLRREVAAVLDADPGSIEAKHRFFDLGLDSLMSVTLKNRLQTLLGAELSVTLAFDYPTVGKLADYLLGDVLNFEGVTQAQRARAIDPHEAIAVVGMGCRFPGGANSPAAFWQKLLQGYDGIGPVPAARWDGEAYYDADPDAAGTTYTRAGGFLDGDVAAFDPLFFGISPREAQHLDPQQRLLLEVTWEALASAGIVPSTLEGALGGVFVGINTNDYQLLATLAGREHIDATTATGNTFSTSAGRLAYVLGLQGPTMALDTACSSSLVGIHLACQSLRNGEADIALAGGVNLMLSPLTTISLSRLRALSPDGRCKTFDAAADGYGRGEGAGMVVLKRYSDALADGDEILALVRGSAVNQDGASGGLTVPNGPSQQAVIQRALKVAGLSPADVDLIEAHGTGTALGDPIEINALQAVFGRGREEDQPLWVSSVKTNIGHLEAAAGIAGFIKLVQAVRHGVMPPHRNLEQPNPGIEWDKIAIKVPQAARAWPDDDKRRVAGVSAFGFSGTNAHVIVEQAPVSERARRPRPGRGAHVLTLSAKSEAALRDYAAAVAGYLAALTQPSPPGPLSPRRGGDWPSPSEMDVVATLNAGRESFPYRLAVVGRNAQELAAALSEGPAMVRVNGASRVGFVFADGGALDDVQAFTAESPTFAQMVATCLALADEARNPSAERDAGGTERVDRFAVGYALAQLWLQWGVEPETVRGYGLGAVIAGCVAGVFSLEDALKLVSAADVAEVAPTLRYQAPRLTLCDGATGETLDAETVTRADTWVQMLADTNIPEGPAHADTLRIAPEMANWERLAAALAELYLRGHNINWRAVEADHQRRWVDDVPSYPYQRQRYWLDVSVDEVLKPQTLEQRQAKTWAKLDGWFYEIEWQEALTPRPSLPNATLGEGETAPAWLILGDAGAMTVHLSEGLQARGATVRVVVPGELNEDELDAVVAQGWQGVLYLWALRDVSADAEGFERYEADALAPLVRLTQALVKAQGGRLWLMTQRAEAIKGEVVPEAGLWQAPVWGLGRVIALEHPEIWGGMIDLDRGDNPLEAVLDDLSVTPDRAEAASRDTFRDTLNEDQDTFNEDQIAYRDGVRYVARLQTREDHAQALQHSRFDARGSYLITGGLGQLGLKVARWLVANGARHLVLTSRRGLTDDHQQAHEAISAMQAQGATVQVAAVDVSEGDQMAALVAALDPALKGVIHAAGVLDAAMLIDLDAATLAKVLRPKVQGSWVLHEVTAGLELDFFLQFSSAASVWGSAMAAHYAAANHFQDALAHYRRGRGLVAQAINWGWWDGGGMVTADEQDYFAAIGLHTMSPDHALMALGHFLAVGETQVTVAPVDWNRYKPVFEAKRTRPLLARIAVSGGTLGESDMGAALRQDVAEAVSDDEGLRLVMDFALLGLREVLRMGDEMALDPEQGFFDMGLDSLTSLELKNWLEGHLGFELPSTLAFEYPTVAALAGYLLAAIAPDDAPHEAEAVSEAASRPGDADANLDALSEDELLALLEDELAALQDEQARMETKS